MTAKEIFKAVVGEDKITALKSLLKIKETFMQHKLTDGTVIEIKHDGDTPMQGNPVMVVTEQGEQPIPDGEYTLENGMKIKTAGGAIAEIAQAQAAPAEKTQEMEQPAATPAAAAPPSQPTSAVPTQQIPAKKTIERKEVETVFKEMFAEESKALSDKIAKLEVDNATYKAEIERLTNAGQETFRLIEKIAGEPSGTPAKAVTSFKKKKEDKPFNADEFMAELKFKPEPIETILP